jgi:glycosyltransferase involved in cell wall biosynthesis
VALVRELSRIADVTVLTLTRQQGSVVYGRAEMEDAVEHRARVFPIADARDTFLYNARFQYELLRKLPGLIRTERFDIVHTQHAHMPDLLAGPLLSGTPLVRTVHTTIAMQREAIRIMESLGQSADITERWQVAIEPLLRTAEWSALHHPGLLFPVCQYTGDHLVEIGLEKERIRVIHNGVDTDRFRPDAPPALSPVPEPTGPTVLFVGRFTLIKGIGTLIRAIPGVVAAVPSVKFRFTGKVPPEFAGELALSPDLRGHLEFLGYVPDDSLPALYASATVVVAPSLYDSFPFTVLEAMASGAAIVSSRVGGIPEAIRNGEEGILVEVGSADELANALVALLKDPELRQRLGSRARSTAMTRFTWPGAARATYAGYREALGDRPPVSAPTAPT